MPKVSIIIPNYNHGEYLAQRIDTVLNQTYDDFEVIILDDCSTDNSREVIETFRGHPKISHIVYNELNSGNTFKQWNKGFALARGAYIWIAESDDYCEQTFLANLIPAMAEDETVVLGFCQSVYVTDKGAITSFTRASELSAVMDGKEFALERALGGNAIPNASMAVFKKSAAEHIPDSYMQMRYCRRLAVLGSAQPAGKSFISGKFLNYYRRHDNNVASGAVKEGLDFIEGCLITEELMGLRPTEQQFEKAIAKRIQFYQGVKHLYSTDVKKQVIESLEKLKPGIKKRLFVNEAKRLFRKTNNAILYKLK